MTPINTTEKLASKVCRHRFFSASLKVMLERVGTERDRAKADLDEALDVIEVIIAADQHTKAGEAAFLRCQALLRKHRPVSDA